MLRLAPGRVVPPLETDHAGRSPRHGRAESAHIGAIAATAFGLSLLSAFHPLAGAAGTVLVVGAAAFSLRPELLTLVIVGTVYSNAVVVGIRTHGVPVVAAVLVPLSLGLPLLLKALRREPVVVPRVAPLLLLFGVVQALSAMHTTDVVPAAEDVLAYGVEGAGLFLLLAMSIDTTRLLRDAVVVMVFVGAVLGALSVYQQLTGDFNNDFGGFAQTTSAVLAGTEDVGTFTNSEGRTGIPRLAGPIGEQNRYAQAMVVLLPLSLTLAQVSRRRSEKVLAFTAAALILAGTVLTYSRGAAVAIVVVAVLGVVLRLVRARTVALLAVLALLALLSVPTYGERLLSLDAIGGRSVGSGVIETGAADGAIEGRATQNLAALLAMRENPLLGLGPGTFPSQYRTYAERVGGRPRLEQREAHNLYLGIGAELGLTGLLCFLGVVGVVLADLSRARRDQSQPLRAALANGFLLALLLYLVSGAFLHLSYQRYFWLLLALASVAGARPGPVLLHRATVT